MDNGTKLDALGSEIILGNTYGYTHVKGSWAHVTIGIARKLTPLRVTLEVVQWSEFLGGSLRDRQTRTSDHSVSVRSYLLFPVNSVTNV